MTAVVRAPQEKSIDRMLGRLLRIGVLVAAAVALAGGLLHLMGHARDPVALHAFRGEPADLTHIGGIVRGAIAWNSASIIQLGLVLLIATPIARVAFALVAFALQRDRVYVVITAIVLSLLIVSLFSGVAG